MNSNTALTRDEARPPTLSVVFPNYNDARFLPMQLDSMLSQSLLPEEIIIIDDASTDDSVEIIETYVAKDSRIRLIRNERNRGVEYNINRLIQEASGDYLYLSAADDAVLPGFFEKSIAMLAQYPHAGLCTGLGRLMSEDGRDTGLRSLAVISKHACYLDPTEVKRLLLKYGRWFALSSMLIKRSSLMAEGGHQTAVGSYADNLAALVVALRHGACFIPEEFSVWRQKTGSHGRSADWRTLAAMGRLIVSLMRTKYVGLFPELYIKRFEQHWSHTVNMRAVRRAHLEIEQTTEVFKNAKDHGAMIDRIWYLAIRSLFAVTLFLWRIFSILRFGTWGWWIRGRFSIIVNRRTVVIWENQNP